MYLRINLPIVINIILVLIQKSTYSQQSIAQKPVIVLRAGQKYFVISFLLQSIHIQVSQTQLYHKSIG